MESNQDNGDEQTSHCHVTMESSKKEPEEQEKCVDRFRVPKQPALLDKTRERLSERFRKRKRGSPPPVPDQPEAKMDIGLHLQKVYEECSRILKADRQLQREENEARDQSKDLKKSPPAKVQKVTAPPPIYNEQPEWRYPYEDLEARREPNEDIKNVLATSFNKVKEVHKSEYDRRQELRRTNPEQLRQERAQRTPADWQRWQEALRQLDRAVHEVVEVAHNCAPISKELTVIDVNKLMIQNAALINENTKLEETLERMKNGRV